MVFDLKGTGLSSDHSAWTRFTDATITSTAAGGTWSDGSTWVGGIAPVAVDNAIIATNTGNTVTLGANTDITDLSINSGALLNGANSLLVTGNAVIDGIIGSLNPLASLSVTGTTSMGANVTTSGTQTYTGLLTLTGTGTRTLTTTNSAIDLTGGVTDAADSVGLTVTGGSGAVTLGSGGTINIDGMLTKEGSGNFVTNGRDITAGGLTVGSAGSSGGTFNSASAGGTWTIGTSGVTINNILTRLNATSGTFKVAGNWNNTTNNAAPFVEGTGTVTLNGASQSISLNETFYNLTTERPTPVTSGTQTLGGNVVVSNNLITGASTTFSLVDKALTIGSTGAGIGTWTNNGTFNKG